MAIRLLNQDGDMDILIGVIVIRPDKKITPDKVLAGIPIKPFDLKMDLF